MPEARDLPSEAAGDTQPGEHARKVVRGLLIYLGFAEALFPRRQKVDPRDGVSQRPRTPNEHKVLCWR